MANYWYVSSVSGAATTATLRTTTDITVQRTGSFASMAAGDHFATIALAFDGDATGAPVAGDIIFVDDAHSTTENNHGLSAVSNIECINVISVATLNCDQYSKGASYSINNQLNDSLCRIKYFGINPTFSNDLQVTGNNMEQVWEDCTLTWSGSGDTILLGSNSYLAFINTTLVWTVGTTGPVIFTPTGAAFLDMKNVTLDDGTGTLANFIDNGGTGGGMTWHATGCDLSAITGYLWSGMGNNTQDDKNEIILNGCKLNASLTGFFDEEFIGQNMYALITNCAATSAAAEYQFYQKTKAGIVEDSGDDGVAGGIYRVQSTAFLAGNKVSFKCTTNSQCGPGNPLMFEMPARIADLANSSEDQITVYIASVTSMTDANTWIEICYPDATNKHEWKTVDSRVTDILSAGTALTADGGSSDWENNGTDLTAENEYKITLTATAGAICVPIVRVYCSIPSITFYVDTTIDLS